MSDRLSIADQRDVSILSAPPMARSLSMVSFVLGVCSVAVGFILVIPTIGIILGIKGFRREPYHRLARWGIALNGVMLAVFCTLVVLVAVHFQAMETTG
ncbi:hypothetical protein [Rathayibacter iranicus]|uniref:DUF4190 domain-containing protein n=2 Tax=Rathayibacter iranicus TaxID=59737 RepID=A0AAD1AEG6_9MICO|nr:hypothetical protein [Rathayibacter iranicus]AZZ56678.1 hypothetical protein C7V51_12920 [Rathayibacter iranicus]MWV31286.1 hypothetical protein [Rathayibacter iranicus NCPPB 2253 = VKM Ac-1602]PPI43323.1 hypothetical protein C5E09_11840 [Rathayibacter iranicus]PPI58266.1 hypothetical protein C5E08_12755 [Rathayibacter iranicus]PPI69381.1 hypothetical protein C5E01_11800 [Rathayibacter iranicus]